MDTDALRFVNWQIDFRAKYVSSNRVSDIQGVPLLYIADGNCNELSDWLKKKFDEYFGDTTNAHVFLLLTQAFALCVDRRNPSCN
jgi:hypothetical protein